jgi:hypothetical protein
MFGTVNRTLDESDLGVEVGEADMMLNEKLRRESIGALIPYKIIDYLALNACSSSERLFNIYRDYIEYKITSNF